jgi:acetyl-CoA carboxylase biotin carboxyl carrier protein
MSDARMTYQELLQIVELINASSRFTEFHLKCGDIEVDIRRTAQGSVVPLTPEARAPVAEPAARAGKPVPALPHVTPRSDAAAVYSDSAVLITSPMVGTFYRAPEPGAPPFVDIGQEVEPESIVCIIEVMKLMHSIPAGCKGTVTHIVPQDGEPVQFGQVLLVIEPH